MHDIEQNSPQNDMAVEITGLPPQKEDTSLPVDKPRTTTGRQKPPRAWRYILIGTVGVLVLALILAGVLSFVNQRAKQPAVRGTTPTSQATTLPTPTPITSQTRAKNLPLPVSKPIPAPTISDQDR